MRLGSIAVGVLLIAVALLVTREVRTMITGESAAPEVDSVINLITLQWGAQLMGPVQAKWCFFEPDHISGAD